MKCGLLCGILTVMTRFSTCHINSLKDIANPQVGIYECTQAELSGVDCLKNFSYIHLELKADGSFLLHYAEKNGEKKQEAGKYVYDRERKTCTMYGSGGYKREFPLNEGVLTLSLRIGEKTLTMTFEQK